MDNNGHVILATVLKGLLNDPQLYEKIGDEGIIWIIKIITLYDTDDNKIIHKNEDKSTTKYKKPTFNVINGGNKTTGKPNKSNIRIIKGGNNVDV